MTKAAWGVAEAIATADRERYAASPRWGRNRKVIGEMRSPTLMQLLVQPSFPVSDPEPCR
ncbi:MAG: hypothetical protein HC833_24715 [Leptolyngbyaceae cyanobacterium RM1_406_9]|nr:hypothetical protein [Leptolyngbyaceae cyanobacterium RM1_406_9]